MYYLIIFIRKKWKMGWWWFSTYLWPPLMSCSSLGSGYQCWACNTRNGPDRLNGASGWSVWLCHPNPSRLEPRRPARDPGTVRTESPRPVWTPHRSADPQHHPGTDTTQNPASAGLRIPKRRREWTERNLRPGTAARREEWSHGTRSTGSLTHTHTHTHTNRTNVNQSEG